MTGIGYAAIVRRPADPGSPSKDHDNLSPALEWSGMPHEAVEPAVICEDPDAPAAPSLTGAGRV
jgi:phosphatidylethanolamine-binding protein (PEBP) family uncharacterized protein